MLNTILWGDTAANTPNEIAIDGISTHTITYSDIEGGWGTAADMAANNIIILDPLFVNPASGDYHLQNGSPCIDAGITIEVPANDIDGESRPQGLSHDIGVDEFNCYDADNDQFFSGAFCGTAVDCDDNAFSTNPTATEICDGLDNDCNPNTLDGADETWLHAPCDGLDIDLCTEGVFECVAGAQSCSDPNTENPELCDNVDNDCDQGTLDGIDEAWLGTPCDGLDTDLCAEGVFECVVGVQSCSDTTTDDLELCDDDSDNNCDGWVDEGCNVPNFYVNVDLDVVDTEPIMICFAPDQPLNTAPTVTFEAGGGTLQNLAGTAIPLGTSLAVPAAYDVCLDLPSTHCLTYTGETDGEEVIVQIDEGTPSIINGFPGSETAYFVVDFLHNKTSSFCIYDGEAGGGTMLSSDVEFVCNTIGLDVYFDAGDLTNLSAGCNIIRLVEVDPTNLQATDNEAVALLCDISLPAGVTLTPDKTVTVTLGITRPAHISVADFEANLQIIYYDETQGSEGWVVIAQTSNNSATINWDDATQTTGTATFETDHLSTFAATSSSADAGDGGGDSGGGTQAASGGGGNDCSVTPTVVNMSTGSALINALILLLPLVAIRIRRRRKDHK